MGTVRVEDWGNEEVTEIEWLDRDDDKESISLGVDDTIDITNSQGEVTPIFKTDIPKLHQALEIAIHYCWHTGNV